MSIVIENNSDKPQLIRGDKVLFYFLIELDYFLEVHSEFYLIMLFFRGNGRIILFFGNYNQYKNYMILFFGDYFISFMSFSSVCLSSTMLSCDISALLAIKLFRKII